MREYPDALDLLRELAGEHPEETFDPDSPAARASLELILATPPTRSGGRRRRRPSRRLALTAIAVLVAVSVSFAVVGSPLGGPRSGIAEAALLTRAAAALEQPDTILYLQAQVYGGGTCLVAETPMRCIPSTQPSSPATGISADPANDTVSYTYREWLSPNGGNQHTIYSTGDEAVGSAQGDDYVSSQYDPANDTVTTITSPASTPSASSDIPLNRAFGVGHSSLTVSNIEGLYQQAQAGNANLQLLGQTTINGEAVYELRVDFAPTPPANPPASDMCGAGVCVGPTWWTLLYVDSQTFLPLRTVTGLTWRPGAKVPVDGPIVQNVTNFLAQSLPDTPTAESLLHMSPHPGANMLQLTQSQEQAEADKPGTPAPQSAETTTDARRAHKTGNGTRRSP